MRAGITPHLILYLSLVRRQHPTQNHFKNFVGLGAREEGHVQVCSARPIMSPLIMGTHSNQNTAKPIARVPVTSRGGGTPPRLYNLSYFILELRIYALDTISQGGDH